MDIRKFYLAIIFVMCTMVALADSSTLTVVDSQNGSPLQGATVFSRQGVIVDIADARGNVRNVSKTDFPLQVSCLGYETSAILTLTDTCRLHPSTFMLNEVTVKPGEKNVARIIAYIREFTSGTCNADTLLCYNEYMGDFFVPIEKTKGFKAKSSPRFLGERHWLRAKSADGRDTIARPEKNNTMSFAPLMKIPTSTVNLREIFKDGKTTATVNGKYYPEEIHRRHGQDYTVTTDLLADAKDHTMSPWVMKLLGMSARIDETTSTWQYRNDGNVMQPADIVSGTFSLKMHGTGKWIKKVFKTDAPVDIYIHYQIYPVEIQYLSVPQAKELLKEQTGGMKIVVPGHAAPLPTVIQNMVN